jgi:biotin synthase
MLRNFEEKIFAGKSVSRDEALVIPAFSGQDIFDLFSSANRIRRHFRRDSVDLCSIINAKSGACQEDCSYCAQSSISSADIKTFPLIEKERIIEKAFEAKKGGAKRFCIVTSGRKVQGKELQRIAATVTEVRLAGLLPCATLGLMSRDELQFLKDSGLERFHHNVETSESFFPKICSTHTYQDKMKTIGAVKSVGLSLCSGGIFGLGETWQDRVDMAFELREIGAESVPVNFLTPIKGTRLGARKPLDPLEALKVISLLRFVMPDREIRVCGGRMQTLGELNPFLFFAGADGLLIGNYLTTPGRRYEDDLRLIHQLGLIES